MESVSEVSEKLVKSILYIFQRRRICHNQKLISLLGHCAVSFLSEQKYNLYKKKFIDMSIKNALKENRWLKWNMTQAIFRMILDAETPILSV